MATEPRNCGDCGVAPGEFHKAGCDVERCAMCGGQAIGCNCIYEVCGIDPNTMEQQHPTIYCEGPTPEMEERFDAHVETLGGRLPWTGHWPGSLEAAELGWFSRWVEGRGWVRCERGDPDAGPDMNRFAASVVWDRVERKYKRPA